MKIRIGFLKHLSPSPEIFDLLVHLPEQQLPGSAYLENCRILVADTGCRLITAPFLADNALCMAYLAPKLEHWQVACYPGGNYQEGRDINIIHTPFGNIALCVGADIFQPQYARLAALRGCRLLICGLWPFSYDVGGSSYLADSRRLFLAGPWGAAQANCLPVALAGPSGGQLILPLGMTEDRSGLGRSEYDSDELEAAYRFFPVFDSFNPGFYATYQKELLP